LDGRGRPKVGYQERILSLIKITGFRGRRGTGAAVRTVSSANGEGKAENRCTVVTTAIAREIAAFLSDIAYHVEPAPTRAAACSPPTEEIRLPLGVRLAKPGRLDQKRRIVAR
jgi:hypothetical protein